MTRVLFIDGSPYWLSEYKKTATHIRGVVENGRWRMTLNWKSKKMYAGRSFLHSYKKLVTVDVPDKVLEKLAKVHPPDAMPGSLIILDMFSRKCAHYEDVIAWAEKQVRGL